MFKKLFDINSPLMQFLLKLFDLMYLQFLVVICSLPIVTIGAAITAMHRVCFRLHRDEVQSVTHEFFSSFKTNFKPSTPLWLLYFITLIFLLINNYIVYTISFSLRNPLTYLLPILDLLFIFSLTWIFILVFRYNNSFFQVIILSFKFALLKPFRTIFMILVTALPLVCILVFPKLTLICSLLGITLPTYLCSTLYSPILTQVEQISHRDHS